MTYRNWITLLPTVGLVLGLGTAQAADLEFITAAVLPWAVVDRPYRPAPLAVRSFGTCAAGGLGYQVLSGALPAGITLSPGGYLAGVPTQLGNFTFTVRVLNGCAWAQQPFTLTVSWTPVLSASPARVVMMWPEGGGAPVAVLNIASSWPLQAYSVRVLGDWLDARSQRGKTVSGGGAVFQDQVELRVRLNGRTEGKYSAMVELTGWLLEPVKVPVEMVIGARAPGVEKVMEPPEVDPSVSALPAPEATHPALPTTVTVE